MKTFVSAWSPPHPSMGALGKQRVPNEFSTGDELIVFWEKTKSTTNDKGNNGKRESSRGYAQEHDAFVVAVLMAPSFLSFPVILKYFFGVGWRCSKASRRWCWGRTPTVYYFAEISNKSKETLRQSPNTFSHRVWSRCTATTVDTDCCHITRQLPSGHHRQLQDTTGSNATSQNSSKKGNDSILLLKICANNLIKTALMTGQTTVSDCVMRVWQNLCGDPYGPRINKSYLRSRLEALLQNTCFLCPPKSNDNDSWLWPHTNRGKKRNKQLTTYETKISSVFCLGCVTTLLM